MLARLVEHAYLVEQARLSGDVDGPPLTGPRRRQILRFLAAVGRHRLNGSVAFTTTDLDDRAFLVTAARHHGFTYAEAATYVTLTADWGRSGDPEARGSGVGYPA